MESILCVRGFSHIEIDERTKEYLISNYGEEGKRWVESIDDIVAIFAEKWNLKYIGQEEKSRFGCILYVEYNSEECVLKLIPPCCERLHAEIQCYFELPYSNMLKIIKYDGGLGGFLLKRIYSRQINDLESIHALFQTMRMQRRKANDDISGLFVYADSFEQSLERATKIIDGSRNDEFNALLKYINRAREYYTNYLSEESNYMLHGDVHIHNLIFDGKQVAMIDPIGYIGPFEIEYARFLGTYIRENDITCGSICSVIEEVKAEEDSVVTILYALGVDVTMRACNTFFEGNTYAEILDAIKWCQNVWGLVDYCLFGEDVNGKGSSC